VNVDKRVKEVFFNEKMHIRKFEGHVESNLFIIAATKEHNKNIVMFSLIETGIMITILIIQMFYIKSILGKF